MNTLYQIFHALLDAERSDSDSRLRKRQAHPAFKHHPAGNAQPDFGSGHAETVVQSRGNRKDLADSQRLFSNEGTYNLNNFSYTNLLLHFAILIERVKTGNSLSEIREIMTKKSRGAGVGQTAFRPD